MKVVSLSLSIGLRIQNKKRAVKALIKDTGLTELVARILVQRGVSCLDDAENFLKPKLDDLHNPELMLNMDKAVKRLNKAILAHERIMVYGDYDVDGTTSWFNNF